MTENFTVKDSGERQQFESGMVRDVTEGKVDYTLVYDGPMLDRWAEHLTKGAIKYDARNWMLADGEAEMERFKQSAARHFRQWMRGDTDEDHAAAVFFNLNGYEYVRSRLPAKIEFVSDVLWCNSCGAMVEDVPGGVHHCDCTEYKFVGLTDA